MRAKTSQQLSFGDGFIDPSLYELDDELQRVDQLLSQQEFLKPFEDVFNETMGRPGTPIPVYLRMQCLKSRFGLTYEEVEREVTERIPWRFFCQLSLQDRVPDSTTLIKLNQRCGDERLAVLNKTLFRHLVKTKAIRPRKIRIDSTTIETHISYPTDIGLLHQVVKTLTGHAKAAGVKISNHVRAPQKALAQLGASLKSQPKADAPMTQKNKCRFTASRTAGQQKSGGSPSKRKRSNAPNGSRIFNASGAALKQGSVCSRDAFRLVIPTLEAQRRLLCASIGRSSVTIYGK